MKQMHMKVCSKYSLLTSAEKKALQSKVKEEKQDDDEEDSAAESESASERY